MVSIVGFYEGCF